MATEGIDGGPRTGVSQNRGIVYYRVGTPRQNPTPTDPHVTHDELIALFRRSGALLDGHFRLTSGLHSPRYLQCALVLSDPASAAALAGSLAPQVAPLGPTVVLSPALGGIVIGHEMGRQLGVRAIFAERHDGRLTLRRGFTLTSADRVLVVEDVVTTGGSTRETMEVARGAGATVVGAASIVDRSAGSTDLGVPYLALLPMPVPTYDPAACPLCGQGVPVVKPGSRT